MQCKFAIAAAMVLGMGTQMIAQTAAPAAPATPATSAAPQKTVEQIEVEHMQKTLADWGNLHRYADENAALKSVQPGENRVVFMGDSITDAWGHGDKFFPGKPYLNRGISGQTTPQMLVRFQQDVVRLHPSVVVILAGTNDVAGNTGPETPEMIEDNFAAMTAIAKQNGIRVVLASITPAASYPWKPSVESVTPIRQLNQWMKFFCASHGCTYLDYYSALVDDKGAMKPGLAKDGVHPTAAGYAIMAPLAEAAIKQALR
jgi:lysophospholipase L1-like esterase